MNILLFRLALGAALCLPLLAPAQALPGDPANAKAPAPALRYQSAFADYRPWQDLKAGDWRALNDNLAAAAPGREGGHAGHGAPPAAPDAKASAPMPPAHHGNHMH